MSLISQTTEYTTPGIYTYTIPQGVSSLELYLWGAGGANGPTGPSIQVSGGMVASGSIQTGTSLITAATAGVAAVANGTFSGGGTWKVPAGVTSINYTISGAPGGSGGADDYVSGGAGQSGQTVSGTMSVQPGQTYTVILGSLGGNGGSNRGSAPGGAGGSGWATGGKGSAAGPNPFSGGGGGGGGASAILLGGVVKVVAAGGGGGYGGGIARGGSIGGGASAGNNGGNGTAKGGDGGGAGGGGGGYPGGVGGAVNPGDRSGNSGTSGTSMGGSVSSGGNGTSTISWGAVTGIAGTAAVTAPVYSTVYKEIFTTVNGGSGGVGGGGGYSNRKIQVTQGDTVTIAVGGAGINYTGGTSLTTPTNYSGGGGGVSSTSGRGGGGGGATVVLVNGVVVAVAAGGGGGGGGGTSRAVGGDGTAAGITGAGTSTGLGGTSSSGPATGGGGGGGYYSGLAGTSGSTGGGGNGGASFGTIIQAGSGGNAGGTSITQYPGNSIGTAQHSGAAILVFTKSFNINVKNSNNWKSVDRAWVKAGGVWKELLNGWTKVSGTWQPLITAKSIEGAENLAAPTTTYVLTPSVSVVDEGDPVTFTLSGTGLTSGDVVAYTANGIDASALTSGALTGSFVVGTTDTITFVPKLNHTTYGPRTLVVILNNKGVSASCIVHNISLTPTYSISPNTASLNEGNSVTFTMSSVNAVPGEIVRWSISGITAADLSAGSMSGYFVVGSAETVAFTLAADLATEGTENITITLDGKGASASCAIADTSRAPIPFTGAMTLSGTGSWTVPQYVTKATFTVSGGGGGGGGSDGGDKNHWLFGLGGAASQLASSTITVSAGQTYSYSIGAGGAGGGGQGAGGGGGTSSVSGVVTSGGGGGGAPRVDQVFHPGQGSSNGGASGGNGSAAGYKNVPGSAGQPGFGYIAWSGASPG